MKLTKMVIKSMLYMTGCLLLAGTAGHIDTHPYAAITDTLLTASLGILFMWIATRIRDKPKQVDAVVEVLVPRGGEYCENPYRRAR